MLIAQQEGIILEIKGGSDQEPQGGKGHVFTMSFQHH